MNAENIHSELQTLAQNTGRGEETNMFQKSFENWYCLKEQTVNEITIKQNKSKRIKEHKSV